MNIVVEYFRKFCDNFRKNPNKSFAIFAIHGIKVIELYSVGSFSSNEWSFFTVFSKKKKGLFCQWFKKVWKIPSWINTGKKKDLDANRLLQQLILE